MKRHLIALFGALAVLLALGSGVAQAQSVQGVEQLAATGQSASSNATSTQVAPSNSNVDVRIFSPGDNGSVSQSNSSAALSAAANKAATTQAATQSQSGAGTQAAGQLALTGQKAESNATSEQYKPSNSNISVRIGSPGGNGDVEQSNSSAAASLAANKAETDQSANQTQAGGGGGKCCSGAGVQAAGQKAATLQDAKSDATSRQDHPSNTNVPVRIFSPGDNGSVSQSNSSAALSAAGNLASTHQTANQTQGGGCGCYADRVQAVGQLAFTGQKAESNAESFQKGAKNLNAPVRIYSEGDDGDVEQSNSSFALSAALNAAQTDQSVDQRQYGGGCGCPTDGMKDGYGGGHEKGGYDKGGHDKGGYDKGGHDKGGYDKGGYGGGGYGGGAAVQAAGQWSETWQKADSNATSAQFAPTNVNAPLRIKSYGGGGSVSQSNDSFAASLALNLARTNQWVRQDQ